MISSNKRNKRNRYKRFDVILKAHKYHGTCRNETETKYTLYVKNIKYNIPLRSFLKRSGSHGNLLVFGTS